MLNTQESVLIVIDVQGKLARVVAESEQVIRKIQQLVQGAKALEIPIILTNQVPEKLGDTIPEIADLLAGQHQVSRTSFSVFREVQVMSQLGSLGRKQVILCGVEAHICLFQSALDLLNAGHEVVIITDAMSSRHLSDKEVALQAVSAAGAQLRSVEMLLFELVRDARHPQFKTIAALIK